MPAMHLPTMPDPFHAGLAKTSYMASCLTSQLGVCGPDLRQRVGAFDGHRVGVVPLGQQPSALIPANPELLGKVLIGGTHDVPA